MIARRAGRWSSSIAPGIRAAALLLLFFVPARATEPETSMADFLLAGQKASVHAIDTTLVDTTLSRWLQRLVGSQAEVSWEVNDCGEACGCPADSARDLPACVQASSKLPDGTTVDVMVVVGTTATGVAGPPQLYWSQVAKGDSTRSFGSLSELQRFMKRGFR